ncbi:MAG TPA: proteasome accessory factor PafA2 family protein, partial [Planctomycetota bacterium]|nr:proteasome accessory factor PafA2 family protein [Planctomycetota bacterium]
ALERSGVHEELTLLSQSYHEIANDASVFRGLEREGLLEHRVDLDEDSPLVEDEEGDLVTTTRARPRARFIREHNGEDRYTVSWMSIFDRRLDRRASLSHPFAQELGPWEPARTPVL